MPFDLPYTALTTTASIWRATMESFSRKDFEDPPDPFYDAVVEAIREISEEVEEAVNRLLIVRRFEQRFRPSEWECVDRWQAPGAGDGNARRTADFDQWPGLQIISFDGDSTLAVFGSIVDDGGIVLVSEGDLDYSPTSMVYFAGYRRPDQTLASAQAAGDFLTCGSGSGDSICGELSDETGLSTLDAQPPTLPGQIERIVKRLVIYEIREQIKALPGFAGTKKTVEGVVIESLGSPVVREAWRASELKKLKRYKRTVKRAR